MAVSTLQSCDVGFSHSKTKPGGGTGSASPAEGSDSSRWLPAFTFARLIQHDSARVLIST